MCDNTMTDMNEDGKRTNGVWFHKTITPEVNFQAIATMTRHYKTIVPP